jgi:MFS family permease
MIVGDFLTIFLVDRFGPKRPIICAACIQSISVLLLVNCNSPAMLNVIEILIGLSFPAILGADSKWLRAVCPKNARYEKYNQMTFWGAQVLSAGIGASLINNPEVAHYVSASCYLLGALLACSLKEYSPNSGNGSLKMTLMEAKRIIVSKYRLVLSIFFTWYARNLVVAISRKNVFFRHR